MFPLAKEVQFSLKVMINKEKTKVLFAEADGDFAEALLSFLALPLGEIVKELEKHYGNKPRVGSLTSLYKGLANLDDDYFFTKAGKQMLLNPRSSFFGEPIKYFRCVDQGCKRKRSVSMYYDARECDCGKPLSRPMGEIDSKAQTANSGIFSEKRLPFLVTDDLQMAPNEPGSMIQTLINLGVVVTEGAELRNVTFGYNEIMDLLKGSLLSRTPLSDTILHNKITKMYYGIRDLLHEMEKEPSSDSKKMIVKAMVQKSTNKLLFVEAEEDFVDYLFSFLTIPLGGVLCLLGGNSSIKNINNLYKSIANLIDDKYLSTQDTKNMLLKPELPPKYLSKNQIFPLSEAMPPTVYYFESVTDSTERTVEKGWWMCFKDPKGDEGGYVMGPRKFMVKADLTVKPLPVDNELRIPLSDVKELELQVGLNEGLNILKSSLGSSFALADGLINPILRKQSMQGK